MRQVFRSVVVVVCALGSLGLTAALSGATPPGGNGLIAFESTRSGNSDIWAVDPAGGDPIQLTTDPGSDYQPRYSPDGSLIAFSSDRDGDFEAFVMNADGSNVRQLTSDPGEDFPEAWTADGTTILSATNRHHGQFELYTIDITTLDEHRITHNPATDIYGSYSPNDATLVFMSDRGGDFDIYAKDVLSGVVTRLTESKAFDAFPDWSPDGTQILFDSERGHRKEEVYVMNADGSGTTRVTFDAKVDDFPVWSPDGTQIAWNCRRDHSLEICVAEADGSGEVVVAAHQADEFTPSWQPIPPG
jgi:Tol biopolymer transport system component